MSEEEDLVLAGELADRVKAFVESDIGQIIEAGAAQDEAEAINDLLELDPYKWATLAELQGEISRIQEEVNLSRKVKGYLADVILRGNEADNLLMSNEEI